MHSSALQTGRYFFQTYWRSGFSKILEIGSRNVNGSLRDVKPEQSEYLGVDLSEGPGVDIVLEDPHRLPFEDDRFDVIVSSSCMEHDQFFWLTFSEMLRVVKPGGLIYINAPANGWYHEYPYDNWRFYPDSGIALEAWSLRVNKPSILVESFFSKRDPDLWIDMVMVFARESTASENDVLPDACLFEQVEGATNIRSKKLDAVKNFCMETEDMIELRKLKQDLKTLEERLQRKDDELTRLLKTIQSLVKSSAMVDALFDGGDGGKNEIISPVSTSTQDSIDSEDGSERAARSFIPLNVLSTIQEGSLRYTYRGVPCLKNPFDFALYAKLIFDIKPKSIIEIGSHSGGSALWLADLLSSFGITGHVYSVDKRIVPDSHDSRLTFIQGDVCDLQAVLSAEFMTQLTKPLLVIEDSAHFYETTMAALRFFGQYLSVGEYIIIEDGIVNDLHLLEYENGPNRAVADFLKETGGRYIVDAEYCDFFGHNFTWNTNGYLKRVS